MKRLERGRLYHCREQGHGQTGHFCLSDEEIWVQLFDYDKFFYLEGGTVLHAQIEDGRTISLHHTLSGGMGHSTIHGENTSTTYTAKVRANAVVVGDGPWESDHLIRSTCFAVRKARQLLYNYGKIQRFTGRTSAPRLDESLLLDVQSDGLTVRCWYGGSGSFETGLNDWWPIVEIEFSEPKTLWTYVHDVHRVLQFLSLAAGFLLTPSDICISQFTAEERQERLQKHQQLLGHQVEYIWPQPAVREYDLHPRNSFVCALDAPEINTMAVCLKAWLDRSSEWEEPSTLMMGSLGMHDKVSGDRLLMACRWLEKIPRALADPVFDEGTLAEITKAAVDAAVAKGVLGLNRRIMGALKNLRSEANRDLFQRLIFAVNFRFGKTGLDTDSVKHLLRGQELRGVIAHGLYDPRKDQHVELQQAFTAFECLCYLLMIKDLPLTPKSRVRAISSRLVRDYTYAKAAA